MKQLLLIFVTLVTIASTAHAQVPVYLVFTSTDVPTNEADQTEPSGVWHSKVTPADSQTEWRNIPRVISLFYDQDNLCLTFISKDIVPRTTKHKNFLKTVTYIDWDIIGPTLTSSQAKAKYQEILQHNEIYCIDRRDIRNDQIELIPVGKPQSRF